MRNEAAIIKFQKALHMSLRVVDVNTLNQLSTIILDSAISVHREMGPGLLESVYQYCMLKELRNRNVTANTNVPVTLHYKGEPLNKEYIIDLLVEDEIVLELK